MVDARDANGEAAKSQITAITRVRLEPPATYVALAALFGALADPTRARIVHLLMRQEWSTSSIATIIGVSAPATSQHLRVLRRLRLVHSRHVGKWVYHRLDDAHVALLMSTSLDHLRDAQSTPNPGLRPPAPVAAHGPISDNYDEK